MKHNVKITIILLAMFIIANLIGIYVASFYLQDGKQIPYGFDQEPSGAYVDFFISFLASFAIAVFIIFLLMKVKSVWFLRGWFFVVVAIAMGISLTVMLTKLNLAYSSFFALILGILLAYIKVFRKNIIVHNITELLIYPGIAAIFIALLDLPFTIALLILISAYDIWAVWHSGVMQKMAKFQIESVGVFSGFFIPYASKKIKDKIKLLKLKYKEKKIPSKVLKKNNIKVHLAILGGGDITFSTIAAGVALKTFGNIYSALAVVLFSSLALLYLFVFAEKKKFYPAMPYLTTGIFIGFLAAWLIKIYLVSP